MKGFPGNMGQIMKEAQRMQERMAALDEEMAQTTVEGRSGGGAVTATASGKGELLKLRIDPKAVDPTDVGMLEDLVLAAVNDARGKAQELMASRMNAITGGAGGLGGMKLPGLF